MDAIERKAFNILPDDITVYRGIGDGYNLDGMSWTLDREMAIWFARSLGFTSVATATITEIVTMEGRAPSSMNMTEAYTAAGITIAMTPTEM